MSAEIKIFTTNTEEIELTLTMTMQMKEWVKLKKQLTTDYPSWELGVNIERAISHAILHYKVDEDE